MVKPKAKESREMPKCDHCQGSGKDRYGIQSCSYCFGTGVKQPPKISVAWNTSTEEDGSRTYRAMWDLLEGGTVIKSGLLLETKDEMEFLRYYNQVVSVAEKLEYPSVARKSTNVR